MNEDEKRNVESHRVQYLIESRERSVDKIVALEGYVKPVAVIISVALIIVDAIYDVATMKHD